jgi:hypothetical protein
MASIGEWIKPNQAASSWLTFIGKLVSLGVMISAGLFYLFNGAMGVKQMKTDVTHQGEALAVIQTDMDSVKGDVAQMVRNDSLLFSGLNDFRIEMRCAVKMLADGKKPGYGDCAPETGGKEQ